MNLSITPGNNNVGAYINDVDLKSLSRIQIMEMKKTLKTYGGIVKHF